MAAVLNLVDQGYQLDEGLSVRHQYPRRQILCLAVRPLTITQNSEQTAVITTFPKPKT